MEAVNNFVFQLLWLALGLMGLVVCLAPLFNAALAGYRWAFKKLFRRVKVTFLNKKEEKSDG